MSMQPSTCHRRAVRFLLMRHGETDADIRKVFADEHDSLTENGRRDARLAAQWLNGNEHLRPTQILSSPLSRARETAQIIATLLQMPFTENANLRERDNGALAGMPKDQAEQQGLLRDYGPDESAPGGETLIALRARAEACWCRLLRESNAGERILVVSHGQMIGMLFRSFLRLPVDVSIRLRTGDTGIHCWEVAGDKRTIVFANSQVHLADHAAKGANACVERHLRGST